MTKAKKRGRPSQKEATRSGSCGADPTPETLDQQAAFFLADASPAQRERWPSLSDADKAATIKAQKQILLIDKAAEEWKEATIKRLSRSKRIAGKLWGAKIKGCIDRASDDLLMPEDEIVACLLEASRPLQIGDLLPEDIENLIEQAVYAGLDLGMGNPCSRAACERRFGAGLPKTETVEAGRLQAQEPFPVASLPPWLSGFALDYAAAVRLDPCLAFLNGLTACSGALGASLLADFNLSPGGVVKGRSSAAFGSQFCVMILAGSGAGKSRSLGELIGPVVDQDLAMQRERRSQQDRYDDEEKAWAQRGRAPAKGKGQGAGPRPEEPPKTRPKRVRDARAMLNKATPEQIVNVLADNPRGILLWDDEIAETVAGYKSQALQLFFQALKASASFNHLERTKQGDGRQDRNRTVTCRAPFAAMSLATQPEPFAEMIFAEGVKSKIQAGGFLSRFYAYESRSTPSLCDGLTRPDPALAREAGDQIRRLLAINPDDSTRLDQDPAWAPVTWSFSVEASAAIFAWAREIDFRREEATEPFRGLVARAREYLGRLALLLYAMHRACPGPDLPESEIEFPSEALIESRGAHPGIPAWAVALAVPLLEWLLGQTERVYQPSATATEILWRGILDYMRTHKPQGSRWTAGRLLNRYPLATLEVLQEMAKGEALILTPLRQGFAVELPKEP